MKGLAMLSYQFLLLLTISSFAYGFLGRKKNITVVGELNCGRNYYSNVKVELWDANTLGRDDKLNSTQTDKMGQFTVFGQKREIRNIEPYLKVHHFCKDGQQDVRCEITDRFDVPKQYQGKTYQLGLVDLSTPTKKRKTKCH
uniref:Transthyretin-like family protein n=1 Tax=Onchocerca volvulus TaxID=6282 RepID=A0A8R1U0I2_ONCVO